MANPIWISESNIGKFAAGTDLYTNIVAKPVYPAVSITYQLDTGSLPSGVTLYPNGYLIGSIQGYYAQVYTFNVRATDNLGNSSIQSFSIGVYTTVSQPTWVTPAGSLGILPSTKEIIPIQLQANPILPAVSLTYSLLSGSLPAGLEFTQTGIISGMPDVVLNETVSSFTIRAIDNFQNIRDRTFSLTVSGSALPQFTLPEGNILETFDSLWIELPVTYNNPDPNNHVTVRLIEGILPPGLEINENGLIRGYPNPPTTTVTLPLITTAATLTQNTNVITCLSTVGFTPGRQVTFSGTSLFGGLEENTIYFIKNIVSPTEFTISTTQNGPVLLLTSGTGFMTVTLPPISVGQPTVRTYSFNLTLESVLGSTLASYSITVINQNYNNQNPPNTRAPVIFNTRPETYNINQSNPYYGYYLLPNDSGGVTYPVNYLTPIGDYKSDNYFAFKIIGHDFDGNDIKYQYNNLPNWLSGDVNTGWLTGDPSLAVKSISQYEFSVAAYKTSNPVIRSNNFTFSLTLSKDLTNDIVWISDMDLGYIYNSLTSTKYVSAKASVDLEYRLVDGELPPNLTLSLNGELVGRVADQPTDSILAQGSKLDYSFTVEAFSTIYPVIKAQRTFNLSVVQEFTQPTDTLYIKATPSIADRIYIDSLLNNDELIPNNMIYRPDDVYFGKATNVVYEHAYGINASNVYQYLEAVTQNHYWRNIVLGELATAIAKDENNIPLYEVVYSKVIDNLVNPQGKSVSSEIAWPRSIDLSLGPWYTSVTNTFTSFENVLGQNYYTSLSPGYANTLYPNSLFNMRNRVGQVRGQEYDSKILPVWMTSQQENGSTLGYTQAWVICYVKPYIVVNDEPFTYAEFETLNLNRANYQSYAEIIKNNIETKWVDELGRVNKLNQINFEIDRFSADKSMTYDYNSSNNPPSWTNLPSGTPVPDPLDSKDFYVLFPHKTILPNKTQY